MGILQGAKKDLDVALLKQWGCDRLYALEKRGNVNRLLADYEVLRSLRRVRLSATCLCQHALGSACFAALARAWQACCRASKLCFSGRGRKMKCDCQRVAGYADRQPFTPYKQSVMTRRSIVCTAQGALADLDEAMKYHPCSAAALRCRGSAKLMLGDLTVSVAYSDHVACPSHLPRSYHQDHNNLRGALLEGVRFISMEPSPPEVHVALARWSLSWAMRRQKCSSNSK